MAIYHWKLIYGNNIYQRCVVKRRRTSEWGAALPPPSIYELLSASTATTQKKSVLFSVKVLCSRRRQPWLGFWNSTVLRRRALGKLRCCCWRCCSCMQYIIGYSFALFSMQGTLCNSRGVGGLYYHQPRRSEKDVFFAALLFAYFFPCLCFLACRYLNVSKTDWRKIMT